MNNFVPPSLDPAPSGPGDFEWRKALAGYIRDKNLLETGKPEEIISQFVKNMTEDHWAWRDELTKYVPALSCMSFIGAKTTVKWVMDYLKIYPASDPAPAPSGPEEGKIVNEDGIDIIG